MRFSYCPPQLHPDALSVHHPPLGSSLSCTSELEPGLRLGDHSRIYAVTFPMRRDWNRVSTGVPTEKERKGAWEAAQRVVCSLHNCVT